MPCCKSEQYNWCGDLPVVDYRDGRGWEYCIFHAPQGEKGVALDEFNDQVFTVINEAKENEENCDLDGTVFEGTIDFRCFNKDNSMPDICFLEAHFREEANFYGTHFSEKANFFGVQFSGDVIFSDARFSEQAFFTNVKFNKNVFFEGVQFDGLTNFSDTQFGGGAFFQRAQYGGEAIYSSAYFSEGAYFSDTQFSEEAHFYKAQFCGDTKFNQVRFGGEVSFYEARFREVSFHDARFSEEVSFYKAQFSLAVDFLRVKFNGEVNFIRVIFIKNVGFYEARFSEATLFIKAQFRGETEFSLTQFSGKVEFYQTQFSGHAGFYGVQFSDVAYFFNAQFSGKAVFYDARFSGEANFREAQFYEMVSFDGTQFSGVASFSEETFYKESLLTRLNINGTMNLENVSLCKVSFLNSDLRKIDFINCTWIKKHGRNRLYDEIMFLEEQQNSKKKHGEDNEISIIAEQLKGWIKSKVIINKGKMNKVETLYRMLKQKYKEEHNDPEVSQWHYSEREMYRKGSLFRMYFPLSISNLYKWSSGYGERPVRAFLVLLSLVFSISFLMWYVGFVALPKSDSSSGVFAFILNTLQYVTFQKTPIFEPKAGSVLGGYLALFARVLIPAQTALFVIAIRNRFRR